MLSAASQEGGNALDAALTKTGFIPRLNVSDAKWLLQRLRVGYRGKEAPAIKDALESPASSLISKRVEDGSFKLLLSTTSQKVSNPVQSTVCSSSDAFNTSQCCSPARGSSAGNDLVE